MMSYMKRLSQRGMSIEIYHLTWWIMMQAGGVDEYLGSSLKVIQCEVPLVRVVHLFTCLHLK